MKLTEILKCAIAGPDPLSIPKHMRYSPERIKEMMEAVNQKVRGVFKKKEPPVGPAASTTTQTIGEAANTVAKTEVPEGKLPTMLDSGQPVSISNKIRALAGTAQRYATGMAGQARGHYEKHRGVYGVASGLMVGHQLAGKRKERE